MDQLWDRVDRLQYQTGDRILGEWNHLKREQIPKVLKKGTLDQIVTHIEEFQIRKASQGDSHPPSQIVARQINVGNARAPSSREEFSEIGVRYGNTSDILHIIKDAGRGEWRDGGDHKYDQIL